MIMLLCPTLGGGHLCPRLWSGGHARWGRPSDRGRLESSKNLLVNLWTLVIICQQNLEDTWRVTMVHLFLECHCLGYAVFYRSRTQTRSAGQPADLEGVAGHQPVPERHGVHCTGSWGVLCWSHDDHMILEWQLITVVGCLWGSECLHEAQTKGKQF